MVLRTQICRFSGLKIYPGRGIFFVRTDGQNFLFLNKKCKQLFTGRQKPGRIAWTLVYRRAHRKDQDIQLARKKRRSSAKTQNRGIAGASLEVINKRRSEKPEVRQLGREAALREIKERMKKTRSEKAATKQGDVKKGGGKLAGKAMQPKAGGKAGKR